MYKICVCIVLMVGVVQGVSAALKMQEPREVTVHIRFRANSAITLTVKSYKDLIESVRACLKHEKLTQYGSQILIDERHVLDENNFELLQNNDVLDLRR